ncbi:hypothetical protein LO771_14075 [Streptacidiphilus sp. ASG 303]|nr:hypothetical protein [Streptacidiphilus sp. ASG 303]MCD0483497.1 hypothetical protein [Streptacidiphilus sp. ASG 303]
MEDALAVSAPGGLRPATEAVPLPQVDEAYARMLPGAARLLAVLLPD